MRPLHSFLEAVADAPVQWSSVKPPKVSGGASLLRVPVSKKSPIAVENNLSSVERLHWYATSIEQEAESEIAATKPPPSWPSKGAIELKNVTMSYRPKLPPVLVDLSVSIRPGEKVGVVGRVRARCFGPPTDPLLTLTFQTGAGKSSIMLTLFRYVYMIVSFTLGRF